MRALLCLVAALVSYPVFPVASAPVWSVSGVTGSLAATGANGHVSGINPAGDFAADKSRWVTPATPAKYRWYLSYEGNSALLSWAPVTANTAAAVNSTAYAVYSANVASLFDGKPHTLTRLSVRRGANWPATIDVTYRKMGP